MKIKLPTGLTLILFVAVIFLAVAGQTVEAFQNMSPDGKTCTPCHARPPQTAPVPAPKPEPPPAPQVPAPAPAPTPSPAVKTQPPPAAARQPSYQMGHAVISINRVMRKTPVLVDNGVIYMRARSLSEYFSVVPRWDDDRKAVVFESEGRTLAIHTRKAEISIDARTFAMKTGARLVDDGTGWRTYVPVRAFAEGLGGTVHHDPSFGIWVQVPALIVTR